jgi:hypothetical protein
LIESGRVRPFPEAARRAGIDQDADVARIGLEGALEQGHGLGRFICPAEQGCIIVERWRVPRVSPERAFVGKPRIRMAAFPARQKRTEVVPGTVIVWVCIDSSAEVLLSLVEAFESDKHIAQIVVCL